jgi:hypothetical protein
MGGVRVRGVAGKRCKRGPFLLASPEPASSAPAYPSMSAASSGGKMTPVADSTRSLEGLRERPGCLRALAARGLRLPMVSGERKSGVDLLREVSPARASRIL